MLFNCIQFIVLIAIGIASSIRWTSYFQKQRYIIKRFRKTLSQNTMGILRKYAPVAAVIVAINWYLPILMTLFLSIEKLRTAVCNWIVLLIFAALTIVPAIQEIREAFDEAFRVTLRIRRLLVMHGITYAVLILVLRLLHAPVYLYYLFIPYATWIAGGIMKPIEDSINRGYYMDAKQKLDAHKNLICIGITGSLGKTITKNIIADMLSERYNVLTTPASYNTVMGVSQTVNDLLEKKHHVFIAEMGAQYKGDIHALVNLVRPKYGIITGITSEHIDTLGTIEGIMNAKQELVNGLPEGGTAFFASDTGYIDRLYNACPCNKCRVAVEQSGDYFVRIHNVNYTTNGTHFTLSIKGERDVLCRTKLMGRYLLQSLALSIALCYNMGMTLHEIITAIEKVKPIRGHMYPENRGYLLLDDRANHSEEGAADALNVLSGLPRRRVVVTRGFDKNNVRNDEYNREFGEQMRGCVDRLILVGSKGDVQPILNSALKHLKRENITIVPDAEAAVALLKKTCNKQDAVLWEAPAE